MAAPTLYRDSLNYINAVCESYVGENVVAVARVVGPFLTTMLVLYVALWGFASIRGLIREPVNEFINRIVKLAGILCIGFNTANYNILITNTFLRGPDEFVAGLARSSGTNGVISGLDAMLNDGLLLTTRFWSKAGVLDGDFGMYLIAAAVIVMTIVVTAYAFFLMALSKVVLTAVVAIGPVFFIGLLFEATAGFFNSWLRQLANYFLVPVLVVMINLLVMKLFASAASGPTAMTSSAEVAEAFPFLAMGLVCLLALASVLSIAAGLAGGVSLSSFGMGRFAGKLLLSNGTKFGKQIGMQGMRPVAWTGKKVARGTWGAYQNRSRNSIRPTKAKVKLLTYTP
ncbi:type IV secretion system protein [Massilia sp. TW-1]|uniref:Type IV secretion system protein n=1 Tax=Telluria antibiotica TaxID=2717319 RepID=A0ABX0P6C2_9BURK|nr:type IV secretion system protein [Telluria antibiotica]NIA52542.1 type IV secretion system protein [Telluria antibiotica]